MKNAIFDDFLARLRDSVDIVSIVSDYVALTRKGKSYWGCCPFHQENTPSFQVSSDKGFFYCFGCQTGGDVFSFLMKKENVGFFDAVKILSAKLNIPLPEEEKTPREKMLEEEAKNIFRAGELARDFYHACLTKTRYGESARKYLANRGIDEAAINYFKLGFAPPLWDKLSAALIKRGVQADILLKAGLAVSRQNKSGFYDRFRGRLMFPIADARGRVIGFGGRSIDNSEPKYLNSPETKFFNKRHVLYAFDLAQKNIKDQGQAVIVEGYLDAITAHLYGFKNVVASLGTAFTQEQAKLLLKCNSPEFVFAYDSDQAGQQASLRAFQTVKNIPGIKLRAMSLPEAKDPDEYLRQNGAADFQKLIDNSLPLLDYQIGQILSAADYSDTQGKIDTAAKLAPVLAASDNAVEVNTHISHLAQKIGIDENALRTEVRKETNWLKKDKNVKRGQDTIVTLPKRPLPSAHIDAEKELIRLMFEHNELIGYCAASLRAEWFKDGARQEIINFIFNEYNKKGVFTAADFHENLHILSASAQGELSGILVSEKNSLEQDLSRVVHDYLKAVELAYLTTAYENHRLAAANAERAGDNNYLQELAEMRRIKYEIKKLYEN